MPKKRAERADGGLNGQGQYSDLAVAKALELLPQEEDATIKACLAQALRSQFAYEGVEPVRQVIHDGNYDESSSDLRLHLIVATTLMEVEDHYASVIRTTPSDQPVRFTVED